MPKGLAYAGRFGRQCTVGEGARGHASRILRRQTAREPFSRNPMLVGTGKMPRDWDAPASTFIPAAPLGHKVRAEAPEFTCATSGAALRRTQAQGTSSGLGADPEVTVRVTKPLRRYKSPKRTLTTPQAPKHAWRVLQGSRLGCWKPQKLHQSPPSGGRRVPGMNDRPLCLLCPQHSPSQPAAAYEFPGRPFNFLPAPPRPATASLPLAQRELPAREGLGWVPEEGRVRRRE